MKAPSSKATGGSLEGARRGEISLERRRGSEKKKPRLHSMTAELKKIRVIPPRGEREVGEKLDRNKKNRGLK